MRTHAKRKTLLFFSVFIILTLACDIAINLIPDSGVPAAAETPVPIEPFTTTPEVFISLTQAIPATAIPTEVGTVMVTVDPLTINLPPALAEGVRGLQVPPAAGQDLPYWELTPGHTIIELEDYVLQEKFHKPQIYVYPATAYAEIFPGAFESMHRLRNVMNDPGMAISADQLPAVPFFNAAQIFASNFRTISFQNGSGVRFLTEYAQYFATVNNYDLIYHFQGFTDDGEYYIIAILPVTAPALAETSDIEAVVPVGGIAFPDINDPNVDMQAYYASVTDLLNATPSGAFSPTLDLLDALIQSMRVNP